MNAREISPSILRPSVVNIFSKTTYINCNFFEAQMEGLCYAAMVILTLVGLVYHSQTQRRTEAILVKCRF